MMKRKMRKLMVAMIAILPLALVSCHDEFMFGNPDLDVHVSGSGRVVRQ